MREAKWGDRALFSGLFLVLFAAKLLIVSRFGGSLPFADEWDAGAARLYGPYVDGTLSIGDLLSAHNEHRIVTSRLLGLAVFELAGEWNPLVLMVVSAALHAGLWVWLLRILVRNAPANGRTGLLVFSALVFFVPAGFENTIMGMNAHFYFLVLFSLLALRLTATGTAFSARWIAALPLMLLAYFSMASGALTPFAATLLQGVQMLTSARRRTLGEILALVALVALGTAMLATVPSIEGHRVYHAHDIGQFIIALMKVAAMPVEAMAGVFVIVQGPVIAFLLRVVRLKPGLSSPFWFVVAVAVWVVAQMVSIAYGRAAIIDSPRYVDLIMIMVPINLFALVRLLEDHPRYRIWGTVWAVAFLVVLLGPVNFEALRNLKRHRQAIEAQAAHVSRFLETGDAGAFVAEPALIPYPDANRLLPLLADPTIRAILPEGLRPVDADVASMREHTLLKGRFSAFTLGVTKLLLKGWFIVLGLGLALLVPSLWRDRKRGRVTA